ncbi:MAG: fused MFS/spermidine synthase [bacterium]|nr:fused MFS/spermidine synthase [bacterium]
MTPERRDPRLLPVAFLSGFTFLAFEVCWHRQMALGLGATVAAATAVLSTFMAGLGAGAWWWGRHVDLSARPGRLLALLLAGIGVTATGGLALAGIVATRSGSLPVAAEWTLAIALLLVPTFLMGGVFPVLGRLVSVGDAPLTVALGRLYAVETLGSASGALATGLVLLGALGQRGTVLLAGGLDLALAAMLLARPVSTRAVEPAAAVPAARSRAGAATRVPGIARRDVLVVAFVCGLASLGLQALWFRLFRVYFTNTSYTFALVSAMAIAGSFVGSAWLARRPPAADRRHQALARVVLLLAVVTVAATALAARLPQVLLFPFEAALADPFLRVLVVPLVAALLVVLPPAACAGYALPLACRLLVRDRRSVGRDFGLGLAVNTAGSVVGPLLATFALLPLLGAVRSVLLLASLVLGAAALLAVRGAFGGARRGPAQLAPAAAAVVLLAVAVLSPAVPVLPPSVARFGRQILHYRESIEGTLTVARDGGGPSATKYSFVDNSAVIGSSYDAYKVVRLVGHLPYLAGLDARRVLVVGFGMGVTASAIAAHPGLEVLECAELVPGLREAASHYRDLNRDVAHDPRLRLAPGDGRRHLQRSSGRYDLISCDPTHPILGSGALYTREWFELCRDRLAPGGMLSQYLPLHKLGERELLGIIRTFHEAFPEGSVWLGQYHAVLLGTMTPLQPDFAQWTVRAASLGRDQTFHTEPHHLASLLVLDAAAVARLTAGAPVNTDDRSYTEFFARGCLDEHNLVRNLRLLGAARVDPAGVFTNVADPARLQVAAASQRLVTAALALLLDGDREGGLALLRQARAADPLDQELPFLVRLHQ